MTLEQIYKLINLVSLKENNGNLFKIYDMNNAIVAIDSMFLRDKIREYEKYQDMPNVKQSILAGKSINEMIVSGDITISTGSGSLPSDYVYFKSATGSYGGSLREVELVTEEEKAYRLTKRFSKPVERYPICTLRGTTIYVWPKSITPVSLTYYKSPSTPYLDYYINSNDRETVLDVNETVELAANETGSEGQDPITALTINAVDSDYIQVSGDYVSDFINASTFDVSGSTGNDNTYTIDSVSLIAGNTRIYVTGVVPSAVADGDVINVVLTSQTVELEYNEDLHLEYAWKIISMLGIRINFQELVQYSEVMQQKSKSE